MLQPTMFSTPSSVAKCLDSVHECADGVRPVVLPGRRVSFCFTAGFRLVLTMSTGECCLTCKPKPPQCEPACTDRQICVPTTQVSSLRRLSLMRAFGWAGPCPAQDGSDGPVPVCRAKLGVCMRLVAKLDEQKNQLKGMTKEQVRNGSCLVSFCGSGHLHLVRKTLCSAPSLLTCFSACCAWQARHFVIELVNRYCEKNENAERCAKWAAEIENLSAESFDNTKVEACEWLTCASERRS
jgi:hypothetical protein